MRILAVVALVWVVSWPAHAEEEEEQDLRERLTEREDEIATEDPFEIQVFGYPLTVAGQYEITLEPVHQLGLGDPDIDYHGFLLEQEIELELFYTLGEPLSAFFQVKLAMEEDLWSQVPDQVSDQFVERGEMWIVSENIAGSGFSFEVGRLDFEDDRRWFWDEDLDSIRALIESDSAELMVAVAREIAPNRSDHRFIEPEQERVLRVFGEASWDWADNHALEAFALFHSDRSPTERVGQEVKQNREDESDATLTWFGARASGAIETASSGIFAYWFQAAGVTGKEKLLSFEERFEEGSNRRSEVEERLDRRVSGWALDMGATWLAPVDFDPRLTVSYAVGSGERKPESGDDRSFRQTGIHSNETGFGGVQSFKTYGTVLDPELSNLHVVTFGVGVSLLKASSLDVAYHYYRLFDPTESLRNARLDPTLTGRHRDLGHGADVVLAIEEWSRFQLEMTGSFFRAGRAFDPDRGRWSYGAFVKLSAAY